MCAQMNYAHDMAKETTINLRVDREPQDKAAEIFARCGFTTSNAIRLFLLRAIKENDWPFDIHQLGPQTTADLEYSIAHPEESIPVESIDALFAEIREEIAEESKAERKAKRDLKRNAKS